MFYSAMCPSVWKVVLFCLFYEAGDNSSFHPAEDGFANVRATLATPNRLHFIMVSLLSFILPIKS